MQLPDDGPVVVGVDGSPASEAALRWACAEASHRRVDVDAVFVGQEVSSLLLGYGQLTSTGVDAEGDRLLRHTLGRLGRLDVSLIQTARFGLPVPELRTEAQQRNAALLVVGRRGFGRLSSLLVGSVSSALAQDPDRPVVIVPAGYDAVAAETQDHHIVVGVDGSDAARVALRWAIAEAHIRDAGVEVVVAWSMPHLELLPFAPPTHDNEPALRRRARSVLDAELLEVSGHSAVKVEGRLAKGDAARALLKSGSHADLVVVGTRGQGSIRQRVLGSTSHAVLHHCQVPLVIVPTCLDESPQPPASLRGSNAAAR